MPPADDPASVESLPLGQTNPVIEEIGGYRILGLLGQGGMGAVYRAQQESPRREVALKIVKAGLTHFDAFRRFQLESQVLGQLEHPGIARIYEAGTSETPEGPQPWFAMEFVRGLPLLEFADKHALDRRQKLLLLAKICDAVHYAHQKGIIHRDLKPANILVSEGDTSQRLEDDSTSGTNTQVTAVGQPKILDFGVARVTNSDLQATTVGTDIGQLVGTIPYMSPEQVQGIPDQIDARSDVYALGVLAHELLTGERPYDLVGKSIPEALRIIEQDEANPLSTFDRAFRGDIDTIVQKALEKECARRYATAAELANDIRRYLRDEPILARPASTVYQIKKFARRNKGLVLGVAAAFLLLIAGTVVSLWQAAIATTAAEKHEQVALFMKDMLRGVTPEMATSLDKALMLHVLSDTAERVNSGTIKDPEVEFEVRQMLAQSYFGLKERDLLRAELEKLDALAAEHPVSAEQVLANQRMRAELLRLDGDLEAAIEESEATLAVHRAHYGPSAKETLASAAMLGTSYVEIGRNRDGIDLLKANYDLAAEAFGDQSEIALRLINALATGHYFLGEYEPARDYYQRSHDGWMSLKGPEHPNSVLAMGSLAMIYGSVGETDKADELHSKATELAKKVFGPENMTTLKMLNNYAGLMGRVGRYEESLALNEEVLDARSRVLGPKHQLTIYSMRNIARIKELLGREDEAIAEYLEVLRLRQEVLGEAHRDTAQSYTDLGLRAMRLNNRAEAAEWFGKSAEAYLSLTGDRDPLIAFYFYRYAAVTQDAGDHAKAEEIYRRTLDIHATHDGEDRNWLGACINGLAKACAAAGKNEEAEQRFREALVVRERVSGEESVEAAYTYDEFGDFLRRQERYEEAIPFARKGLAARIKTMAAGDPAIANARATLAASLFGAEQFAEAETHYLQIWHEFEASLEPSSARRVYVLERLVNLYTTTGDPSKLDAHQTLLSAERALADG